jgi:hypothetical protein
MKILSLLVFEVVLFAVAGCEAVPLGNDVQPTILGHQVSEIGVTSIARNWSNFGAYLLRMITSVQGGWDRTLGMRKFIPTAGARISVTFVMNSNGEIIRVMSHDDLGAHASQETVQSCIIAIIKNSPYDPWTDDMVALLGTEQKMTFTFFVP